MKEMFFKEKINWMKKIKLVYVRFINECNNLLEWVILLLNNVIYVICIFVFCYFELWFII